MISSTDVSQLAGEWTGVNRLWMSPEAEARESAGTASVALVAQGQFLTMHYTWAFDGQPQDGILLVGVEKEDGPAAWTDSWHMSRNLMVCERQTDRDGAISVSGSYPAPPGPDWGWRVAVGLEATGLVLRMFNIPPGGPEALAVEAVYARGASSAS